MGEGERERVGRGARQRGREREIERVIAYLLHTHPQYTEFVTIRIIG
jgi:hypothetical protein